MMKKLTKGALLLLTALSMKTGAVTTGLIAVTSIKITNDNYVTVTVGDPVLNSACFGELTFIYSADGLSEIYYAMLMTAKSVGTQVNLSYVEPTGGIAYCELYGVAVSEIA